MDRIYRLADITKNRIASGEGLTRDPHPHTKQDATVSLVAGLSGHSLGMKSNTNLI